MNVLIVQAGVHVFNLVGGAGWMSAGIINSDEPLISRRDVTGAGLIGMLDVERLSNVTERSPLDIQLETVRTNSEYWHHPDHDGATSLYWLESEKPAARIMTPTYALRAMRNYLNFDIALFLGDIDAVEIAVDALKIASPIAEIRKHINMQVHDFDGLVKRWVLQGMDPLRIAAVARKYMDTMPDTPTAQDQFLGDWYRDIASGASRQGFPAADALLLVGESRRHYERCIEVNPSNPVVRRKLELLGQLQFELQC